MKAPSCSTYQSSASSYDSDFGSPGSSTFRSATSSNTGASTRSGGLGLYPAFFNKTGVTKVALCDDDFGFSNSMGADPTNSARYAIYDLVATTTKTFYTTLYDIDTYLSQASSISGNDSVWGSDSVENLVAGSAKSGSLSSWSGHYSCSDNATPSSFCMWGINRDSDNDTQALCFYSGNLQSGKGDSWRGVTPKQTFFTYWGQDFHSNSQQQRIGNSRQSYPGWCGSGVSSSNIILLAYTP